MMLQTFGGERPMAPLGRDERWFQRDDLISECRDLAEALAHGATDRARGVPRPVDMVLAARLRALQAEIVALQHDLTQAEQARTTPPPSLSPCAVDISWPRNGMREISVCGDHGDLLHMGAG